MPKLPSVSGERVVKALKRAGFVQLRQKGSHVSLEKRIDDRVWKTIVPMHSEVARGTLADSETVRLNAPRIPGTSVAPPRR